MNLLLGDLTVILNVVVLLLVVGSILRFFQQKRLDLQFLLLLGSILLLQPVIIFENILYLEVAHNIVDFNFSRIMMRFFFSLGTIAYLVYNLHLMTIEDLPSFPIAITAIIVGFGIGVMAVSAQVDDTQIQPIYYEPIAGGILFISSLMLFNIIGELGFFLSVFKSEQASITKSISTLDMFGIFFFFISPMAIFLSRIMGMANLPVNAIFLVTLLGFGCHLFGYILQPEKFGYPVEAQLVSLSIIDMENSVVIAGLSTEEDKNFNKLQGMTIMAVDSVIKDVFEADKSADEIEKSTVDYGDTILLRNKNFLLVSLFRGKGKKIGKFALNLFLEDFAKGTCLESAEKFKFLVRKYLYTFFKKKITITDSNIFLSTVKIN